MNESVEEFSDSAAAWLAKNLERRDGTDSIAPINERFSGDYTKEFMAIQRALQAKVFDGGYAGITWPVEYGGQGLTAEHERVFRYLSAEYVMPDLGVCQGTTYGICGPTILDWASHEFKLRHVPRMLRAEELWCQFFSEPAGGSDLAGVATRAERDGDEWVINGSKTWTSGAHLADFGLCLTRTDPTLPKHRGLTWFAVPIQNEGVLVRRIKQIDGSSRFCEEFLTDVRVSDADRVGDVNDGWSVARAMLVFERDATLQKARAISDPGPLAPDLVALARSVHRENEDNVRLAVARVHTNDYLGRQLPARVGATFSDGTAPMGVAAYGKLAAGIYDPLRAIAAMAIAGSAGTAWLDDDSAGKAVSTKYLLSRAMAIAGGSNEMQRNSISERILGLPKDDIVDPFGENYGRRG